MRRSIERWPDAAAPPPPRTPLPAPDVALTAEEKQVWAQLPPDRSAIPVLLYHGIGPESDFANEADAGYGIDTEDFAKQMTMIQHAGYETIDLKTFLDFVAGKPVELPPRPLLLTFDDARADSWTGADGILSKLGFNAVMFVDVGRVEDGDPEYLTWHELRTVQDSGRWQLQLHSGHGHTQIQYGPGAGRLRAVLRLREAGRGLRRLARARAVRHRVGPGRRSPIRSPRYQPLAFAPPYGSYGQDGTNDPRIPDELLGWLTRALRRRLHPGRQRTGAPGSGQPLGRIQVTRATTGGDLHEMLLSGEQ